VFSGVGSIDGCEDSGNGVCYANGDAVLSYYGFSSSHAGLDVGVLIGLIVFFRTIAYLFLLKRSKSQL
jgi:hypothetical protein